MGVLDELERPRPAVLDGVAHPVQRPDTRVAAVGEDHPRHAPEADHLVEEDVRREPDDGEVGVALAQKLVAGGERDEVREALQGDEASIPHQRRDSLRQRLDPAGLLHPGPPVRSSCAHMCATRTHYLSAMPRERVHVAAQTRSTVSAMPCPTPMHSVPRPRSRSAPSSRLRSPSTSRTPDAPSGWPTAIAPP